MIGKIRGRVIDFSYGDLDIVISDDGSHTVYHRGWDETYHSLSGAFTESLHVFIQNGLFYYLKRHIDKLQNHKNYPLKILEIGWGSGLNCLLTMERAIGYGVKIYYLGLEPHPLPEIITSRLNYRKFFDNRISHFFPAIHLMKENDLHQLSPLFSFKKIYSRINDLTENKTTVFLHSLTSFDLVYFDAFGMSKQEEPWQEENFMHLNRLMEKGSVLVTYASNRILKERLENHGLQVFTVPGPPPKREMTRAIKM